MNSTRAIALTGLGLALALAVGALQPARPEADASGIQPIFSSAPGHVIPTPALPTAAPTEVAAPAEQPPAALVVEQPTPQVIQLPAPPPIYVQQQPQVIYVEQPAAQYVEQPPAEQPPAAPVESAGSDYQQRRLDAINSGAAYRPRTR